jgi:hypothetical protein
MKQYFFVLALSAFLVSSCEFTGRKQIRGNGDIKTEARTEQGFQSFEISGAFKVYVKQDSAYSIKVEADANLMEYIEIYTDKNTLVVNPKNGYNLRPTSSVKVYISSPRFRVFDVSGASHIYSEGRIYSADELFVNLSGASSAEMDIKSPKVVIEVSGASTARLTGETKDLDVDGSGASHSKCFGLMSENADVDLSGASGAEVFALVKLNASASGVSHVKYKGNATVTHDVSGAGSVRTEGVPIP